MKQENISTDMDRLLVGKLAWLLFFYVVYITNDKCCFVNAEQVDCCSVNKRSRIAFSIARAPLGQLHAVLSPTGFKTQSRWYPWVNKLIWASCTYLRAGIYLMTSCPSLSFVGRAMHVTEWQKAKLTSLPVSFVNGSDKKKINSFVWWMDGERENSTFRDSGNRILEIHLADQNNLLNEYLVVIIFKWVSHMGSLK